MALQRFWCQAQQGHHLLLLLQGFTVLPLGIPPVHILPSLDGRNELMYLLHRMGGHQGQPAHAGHHVGWIEAAMQPPVHIQTAPRRGVHGDIPRRVDRQGPKHNFKLPVEVFQDLLRYTGHGGSDKVRDLNLSILGCGPGQDLPCIRELARKPHFQTVAPLPPSFRSFLQGSSEFLRSPDGFGINQGLSLALLRSSFLALKYTRKPRELLLLPLKQAKQQLFSWITSLRHPMRHCSPSPCEPS